MTGKTFGMKSRNKTKSLYVISGMNSKKNVTASDSETVSEIASSFLLAMTYLATHRRILHKLRKARHCEKRGTSDEAIYECHFVLSSLLAMTHTTTSIFNTQFK